MQHRYTMYIIKRLNGLNINAADIVFGDLKQNMRACTRIYYRLEPIQVGLSIVWKTNTPTWAYQSDIPKNDG